MISNLVKLEKMHSDKPWLYEDEEHEVLKLARDAIEFITEAAQNPGPFQIYAQNFLANHK